MSIFNRGKKQKKDGGKDKAEKPKVDTQEPTEIKNDTPQDKKSEAPKESGAQKLDSNVNYYDEGTNEELTELVSPLEERDSAKLDEIPGMKKKSPKKLIFALSVIVLILFAALIVVNSIKNRPQEYGERGKLVWWGFTKDAEVVQPLIDAYVSQHPDVEITYIKQSPQDYRVRLTNELEAGTGPDIFELHNTWPPMFKEELDTLPENVMSNDDFYASYYPVVANDLTTNKGIVGIPLEYDALTLFVNQDIFAAAAKTPPSTWDELKELAKELAQRDENKVIIQAGVALGNIQNVDHWPDIVGLMLYQNRANPAKPQECVSVVGASDTEEQACLAFDALDYYISFEKDDKDWDETLPPSTVAFANNKLAMYIGPSWRAYEIAKMNPNLKFRTLPLPQLSKEKPSDSDVTYATYWFDGVWNKTVNKDIAWDFLKFISSEDSLKQMNETAASVGLRQYPYPRTSMRALQASDDYLSSVISLAIYAKSWYLASDTYDGDDGINSQINTQYGDAITELLGRPKLEDLKIALGAGIAKVLAQYSIQVK